MENQEILILKKIKNQKENPTQKMIKIKKEGRQVKVALSKQIAQQNKNLLNSIAKSKTIW